MNINNIVERLTASATALLLCVALSSTAFADTGALNVVIVDADGNPVAGANVSASSVDSLVSKAGVTSADGQLRLTGLDPSDAYVIRVTAEGYAPARNEGVLVVSERTFNQNFVLQAADESLEEIVTYGRTELGQLVDTSSALVSTDVTLEVMDSLPTGRTYQSYLQMAPSTKPTPVESGNPSSKSGVNYQEIVDSNGNVAGTSTDNIYYIDGVNVTDNNLGTFGANFNTEIIQEQQIITGGIPAEYEGGQGLVSRVITKSGSNEFHGSINYYVQNDSLVGDNDNLADATFSTFDTAFTLGGPIVRDKLWFFASLQRKEREEDIIDPVTQTLLRTVDTTEDLGFAKLTWQITDSDRFVAEFFNDPFDRTGSTNIATLNNRDAVRVQGGDNYKVEYSHAWENLIVTANFVSHEGELSDIAADKSTRNDVAYTGAALPVTNVDTLKGGLGRDLVQFRNKESINLNLEWFLDAGIGSHEIKVGYSQITNDSKVDNIHTGDGAQYTSLGITNPGLTLDDYTTEEFTGSTRLIADDYVPIKAALDAHDDFAYFLTVLDTDMSGTIELAEIGAYSLDQTTGNPTSDYNVYRIDQVQLGPTDFKTEGDAFYIQDTWSIDEHWTINAGFRAEKWEHVNTAGEKVFTFDYEIAPRLSLIYDVNGDGRSKIWGFYGRYYDPIRTNMTAFAGTVTGSVRDEQVYIGNQWVTWRTRGGPGDPDGFFAPTTKTPYTDEFMVGYERSLTENQSVSITYTNRVTEDIMEDYDLPLYTTPSRCGDLCLPLSYFGFETAPAANFFIATLAGAKREYQGIELAWRKRRSADSNWFGLASYSFNDATGNSNSDSNADFQGDIIWLDPRAINMTGDQPGNVEHLFKLAGSYRWENGIEVGATYLWNSGTLYSETFLASSRHLPIRVASGEEFLDNGTVQRWVKPGAVGGQSTDSYGILNARAKYVLEFGDKYTAEFFLDVFNVLDNQAARRNQDLSAGDGVFLFNAENGWVQPRRIYLGARLGF